MQKRPFFVLRNFTACCFALVLLAGWLAYAPGLHGSFIFDDFNNLAQLGAYGAVDNLRSFLLYMSSGNADPTGRPLALLSFLLDANDWPAEPEPFKYTNILLHLLNGVLLTWVLLKLGRRINLEPHQAEKAAVLGAALWTLHPLFVSTTLYIVQREAMLPATFTLTGTLLWLSGTERRLADRPLGWAYLLAGAWGCTALAVLSKGNGILLPLLLLVMDWTLPVCETPGSGAQAEHSMRLPRRVLLGLPSLLISGWLLSKVPSVFGGDVFMRPWSVAQRLLTEPRVICDYLRLLWIPRASGTSVFNDDYMASTGLLHPWPTLPALAAVLALVVAGFALRRKQPPLAFAILFYLTGHLLESSLIPLELYFEHRNYLPALMMFWPLALWLTGKGPLPALRLAMAFLLPIVLALLCRVRAEVWGAPQNQAQLLAKLDPSSPRAQVYAATREAEQGHLEQARQRLQGALAHMPEEAQLALNLVTTECRMGQVSASTIASARYAITNNLAQTELVEGWLTNAIEAAQRNECRGLDLTTVADLIDAMRQNPHYSKGLALQHDILHLKGRVALAHGNGQEALHDFNAGLALFPTPDGAMLQAALLGSAGFAVEGLEHLHYFKTLPPADRGLHGMADLHLWLLRKEGYWDSEWAALEKQLREDATRENRPSPSA